MWKVLKSDPRTFSYHVRFTWLFKYSLWYGRWKWQAPYWTFAKANRVEEGRNKCIIPELNITYLVRSILKWEFTAYCAFSFWTWLPWQVFLWILCELDPHVYTLRGLLWLAGWLFLLRNSTLQYNNPTGLWKADPMVAHPSQKLGFWSSDGCEEEWLM